VAAVYGPRTVRYVRDSWNAASAPSEGAGGRLFSLAPEERPDYARVSLKALAHHPVAGLGAGNFGREYDAHRRFDKHSRYPHDLVLRAASEGGIVGLALFLGLVGSVGAGLVAVRRRLAPTGQGLMAASAAMGAYFLLHGELDWLEAFPALVMPVVGLAFAVLVLPPRAARWNPVSPAAAINQGALALQLGEYKRATRSFNRALERETNWVPYLELALIQAHSGRFGPAGRLLDRAAALDANDPVIADARAKISHHVRLDPGAVNAVARQSPLFTPVRIP